MNTSLNRKSQEGTVLAVVLMFSIVLLSLVIVSMETTKTHATAVREQAVAVEAELVLESGAAQALARLREGGFVEPVSGEGIEAEWVSFGGGEYYYYSVHDESNKVTSIKAWARIAIEESPSSSKASPDAVSWNGTGWYVRGRETLVTSGKYIPEAPAYFGNGGIQRPSGGFSWGASVDPADPSTWIKVGSSIDSWQMSTVPFEVNSLDFPADYLYNGGTPTPLTTVPHPYSSFVSQTPIGQFNAEAWFQNSAGPGDPTSKVTPSPDANSYDMTSISGEDYPYPVDSLIPDVQDFAWELWSKHQDAAATHLLDSGAHYGDYGTVADPRVTFVTGTLTVPTGKALRGTGILVVRDDYDPNVDLNNQPSTYASLNVSGTLEWTGLVIVAGWNPLVRVSAGGEMTVVGSLFGEDSVQSGGEISLDSASIILQADGPLRLYYSNSLFATGGLINEFLPSVVKRIVGLREL